MSQCESHRAEALNFVDDYQNWKHPDCPWCRITELEANLAGRIQFIRDTQSDLADYENQVERADQAEARIHELEALLMELTDIEGPQPGHVKWYHKVQTALAGGPIFASDVELPECPPCQLELGGTRCSQCGYSAEECD